MGGDAESGFDLVDRRKDRGSPGAELVFRGCLLVDRDEPGRNPVGFASGRGGGGAGVGSHAGYPQQPDDEGDEDRDRDCEERSKRLVGRAHAPGGVERPLS